MVACRRGPCARFTLAGLLSDIKSKVVTGGRDPHYAHPRSDENRVRTLALESSCEDAMVTGTHGIRHPPVRRQYAGGFCGPAAHADESRARQR